MSKWTDEFCSQFKTIGDIQKHTSQNKLQNTSIGLEAPIQHLFQSRASGSGKNNYTLSTLQGMSPAQRKKAGEQREPFLFLSEGTLFGSNLVSSQETK